MKEKLSLITIIFSFGMIIVEMFFLYHNLDRLLIFVNSGVIACGRPLYLELLIIDIAILVLAVLGYKRDNLYKNEALSLSVFSIVFLFIVASVAP